MKVVLVSADESRVGMGVRTLSACLREQGFETIIVFMASFEKDLGSFHWPDLIETCRHAGLIGISCMTHAVDKAVEIKRLLAGKISAPIIVGGIQASIAPETLVEHFPLICHGEGEDLMVELARRIRDSQPYTSIPGLWICAPGETIKNPPQPLLRDINLYPFPDYDLTHQFVLEANHLVRIRPVPFHMSTDDFVVMGSRGCPHHCTYCCNRKIKEDFPWRRKVAHYSIDYLLAHLRHVCGVFPEVKSFWIEDDTFFAKSLAEIEEFAARYKREIALPFKILISPWTYEKSKLDPLVDAGMVALMLGIQSGSERVNKELYQRNMTNERLLQIAKSISVYPGMLPCYDFIGMNPFENAADLTETIRFIRCLPTPCRIFSNNLAFYPGTKLHERAVKAGVSISRRVKHSEPDVGYDIIIHDALNHKMLHLLLLLMGGMATRWRYGLIPKFLIADGMLWSYRTADRVCPRLANGVAVMLALLCKWGNWRKLVKAFVPSRALAFVRHGLARMKKG